MAIRLDIAKRVRQLAVPLLCVSVLGYFLFHTIQGDRGVVAWLMLKQELRGAEAKLAGLEAERMALANRVSRLSPQTLDPDLLDEQARLMLNLAAEDEVVIMRDRLALPDASDSGADSIN
jgi:cell division protein FtsB